MHNSLSPYSYCVQRGFYDLKSDHLILSLEWKNLQNKTALVRIPYLKIIPKDPTNNNHIYYTYVADYLTVSRNKTIAENGWTPSSSFIVPPKSISGGWRVFRTLNYNTEDPLYNFQFTPGTTYDVFIGYELNGKIINKLNQPLLSFKISKDPSPSQKIECYHSHPQKLLENVNLYPSK